VVSAANLANTEVTARDEVHENSVRGSLCNAHLIGDLTDADVWSLSDCQQDAGMVSEEIPTTYLRL
jgi:hypothetical protein